MSNLIIRGAILRCFNGDGGVLIDVGGSKVFRKANFISDMLRRGLAVMKA